MLAFSLGAKGVADAQSGDENVTRVGQSKQDRGTNGQAYLQVVENKA
jgi:hypothetical protein